MMHIIAKPEEKRKDDLASSARGRERSSMHSRTLPEEAVKEGCDEVTMEYIETQDLQENDGDFHIAP